jgi:hypothetical protein
MPIRESAAGVKLSDVVRKIPRHRSGSRHRWVARCESEGPVSAGILPTDGMQFVFLIVGTTFFPALALSPLAEHYSAYHLHLFCWRGPSVAVAVSIEFRIGLLSPIYFAGLSPISILYAAMGTLSARYRAQARFKASSASDNRS